MKLFLVLRWGHDSSPDGANGDDTLFLVRADDYLSAIALVEPILATMPHCRVGVHANVCIHVGIDATIASGPKILLGPLVQSSFASEEYRVRWVRHCADDDWKTLEEMDNEINH